MGALGPNEGVAAELADGEERDDEVLAPATPGAEGLGTAATPDEDPEVELR
ncbi:hypothetical protein H7K45_21930 [Mycobacterium yunnanensis]|uniref:Uncharacterized protein n=1 Tax=Mycobacterium yunnanensis TaxID=368477 RepID=A0A9X3C2S6_9MYCO|nr:hypothetical protein [Mycobacterium yunnanensis]MCV7423218.1 hypothetical protein [Mycobacterium yunnanensis]